ncbi:MAG: fasciclin domain-containing protein [Bacteroidetes bacterium]|nr:fasciclin domain-containing protein [Bacteroidota bacterium]MBS1756300.1 fasciclin domain-containing protein [Bacteroidota bacterium]
MNSIIKRNKWAVLVVGGAMALLSSCNKDLEQFPEAAPPPASTAKAIGDNLKSIARDSLFYKLVQRAGLLDTLNKKSKTFTVFVPDSNAIKGFLAAALSNPAITTLPNQVVSNIILTQFPAATANAIVNYNIVPQSFPVANFPRSFPNVAIASLFNPQPSASAFLRLDLYLYQGSTSAYANNIPIVASDIATANGYIQHTAALLIPPSQFLWDRINTDADLTFLKAAVLRADSGTTNVPGTLNQGILQSVLSNIGPDLTVFAPSNQAFINILYAKAYPIVYGQLYQGAYAQAIGGGATPTQAAAAATAYATANAPAQTTALVSSPTVFQNPALFPFLPASSVKGILVSHILGKRAYTNNFPITATNVPTLLNSAIPSHPGVALQSTFIGLSPFSISSTVKGAYNLVSSNVSINNTSAPFGTSDQNYLNGVLHKIDQVLIPAPL